jgi:VanZ family protein
LDSPQFSSLRLSSQIAAKAQFWPFLDKVPYGDKFGHVILFGTLCFLCNLAFPNLRLRFLPRFVTATTFVLLILISLEEISQAFIPSRTCDINDWLADLLGLAIGQTAAVMIRRKPIRSKV